MSTKIIFLGAGDAMNSEGQAQQAILLSTNEFKLLVDCGANTLMRLQQMKINPNEIDAVLFTHFHADHFIGTVNFDLSLIFNYPRSRNLLYMGPTGLQKQCEKLFDLSYPTVYPNDSFVREFSEYEAGKKYVVNDGKAVIETFAMKHAPESLGYRIFIGGKYIAITGDTSWHDGILDLAKGSDCLICESFHYGKPQPNIGHCSYAEIREHKDKIATEKIILTHTSSEVHQNKDTLDFTLALDGNVIEV